MIRPEYNPETFYHWTTIKVRFRDLDPLNHVNNSVFNTYFEEARIDFIRHTPELNQAMNEGKSFILAHLEIDYIKPIFSGETILAGTAVKEIGNTSIYGIQAIYSEKSKELKAVCETTGVWFDLNKNRPSRIPDLKNPDQYRIKADMNG